MKMNNTMMSLRRLSLRLSTFTLIAALALTAMASTAAADHRSINAHSQPAITLQAQGLSARALEQMSEPVVIDRALMHRDLRGLQRDIRDLERVADHVREPRLREALCAQISRLRQRADGLHASLREASALQPVSQITEVYYDRDVITTSPARLDSMIRTLKQVPFHDERLQTLKSIAGNNLFNTEQVRQLATLFPFNDDKLEVLTLLYPNTIDPENYHALLNLLPFSKDRSRLLQRIAALDSSL